MSSGLSGLGGVWQVQESGRSWLCKCSVWEHNGTHGWQMAVDGSWGHVPGRAGKVAAWGLMLWSPDVPPSEWAAMGGEVPCGREGRNGSAWAELETLRVTCQYAACPPIVLSDSLTCAMQQVIFVCTDSLWAASSLLGEYWPTKHLDVLVPARRLWLALDRPLAIRHVTGHDNHIGNCWAHEAATHARAGGPAETPAVTAQLATTVRIPWR